MICKDTEFGERWSEVFDKCMVDACNTISVGYRNCIVLEVLLITRLNVWAAYAFSPETRKQLFLISIFIQLFLTTSDLQ